MDSRDCPLTAGQLRLLEACVEHGTANTEKLAGRLSLSLDTVRTQFKRIFDLLGVHGREEALLRCMAEGWVRPPGPIRREPPEGPAP